MTSWLKKLVIMLLGWRSARTCSTSQHLLDTKNNVQITCRGVSAVTFSRLRRPNTFWGTTSTAPAMEMVSMATTNNTRIERGSNRCLLDNNSTSLFRAIDDDNSKRIATRRLMSDIPKPTPRLRLNHRSFWTWRGGDDKRWSLSSSSSEATLPDLDMEDLTVSNGGDDEDGPPESFDLDGGHSIRCPSSAPIMETTELIETATPSAPPSSPPSIPQQQQQPMYQVSACTAQGFRTYMEDEFFLSLDGDFAAVFDGHGGRAVSRYLRQNLYANLQALLPVIVSTPPPSSSSSTSTKQTAENKHHVQKQDSISKEQQRLDVSITGSESNSTPTEASMENLTDGSNQEGQQQKSTSTTATKRVAPTVQDYENAMLSALDKVDREVQRISHWSYQGSTAVAVWIHEDRTAASSSDPTISAENTMTLSSSLNEMDGSKISRKNTTTMATPGATFTTSTTNNNNNNHNGVVSRTIIAANIGDSRAVLCRNGTAWDLTRDHKPNDPLELERIESMGGKVVWCGEVDREGQPILEQGIYRVNGNLALSRAIGDRSERPIVTAEPEIISVPVQDEVDEFILLASDGLWDVMDSQDAVDYIRSLLLHLDGFDRDMIATSVVEEALRRGTYDNITVLIIWLTREDNCQQQHHQSSTLTP